MRARLASALRRGQQVGLFLDYDGTLREIVRDPGSAHPTPEVRATLDRLAAVPGLDVTVISGRTPATCSAWLGDYPFGLIAEHGAAIRRAHARDWEQLDRNVSYAWKDPLLKFLRQYEASTPGAAVEQKRTSLVWHYRGADPEFGSWKANALAAELATLVANDPVEVRHGKKIVEVTAARVNKGAAVARILDTVPYDLIVCAGDDATDESMFAVGGDRMASIKVGDGETKADCTLRNPAALRALLEEAVDSAAAAR